MKIHVFLVGKTSEAYLKEGIDIYLKRITNYISLKVETLTPSKEKDKKKAIKEESRSILSKLLPADFIVVLDEGGKEISSKQLAELFQTWMVRGIGRVVFITGGAYGINPELKQRSDLILSLSKLTFTHQMVRLIFFEQVYRAMTIIKNENYHHD